MIVDPVIVWWAFGLNVLLCLWNLHAARTNVRNARFNIMRAKLLDELLERTTGSADQRTTGSADQRTTG